MPFEKSKSYTSSTLTKSERHTTQPQNRIRLLRPSFLLYVVVSAVIALITAVIGIAYTNIGTALLVAWVFGISPGIFAPIIAKVIAKVAERKRCQPNVWFAPDAKREKRLYGPLRAHRLFGHKLGRGSGVRTGHAPQGKASTSKGTQP